MAEETLEAIVVLMMTIRSSWEGPKTFYRAMHTTDQTFIKTVYTAFTCDYCQGKGLKRKATHTMKGKEKCNLY